MTIARSVWVLVACSGGVACAHEGAPCAAPSCGAGYECLGNRCLPVGSDPVPAGTERWVVEPAAIAVVGSPGGPSAPTVTLGSDPQGDSVLYVRFDPGWKGGGEVAAAFLLLEPSPGAEPNREDVPLEVWTVDGPWSPDRVTHGARPGLGLPRARGLARTSPPSVARIDVTVVARALAGSHHDDGVAIVARRARGSGVTLLTGVAGGSAPRLEVYLRRARPRSAAW